MARKAVRVISRNGKRYLSLNYAAPLAGYHKDYLGQLIRKGKLSGERIGSTWFVEENIFNKFCEKPAFEAEVRDVARPVSSLAPEKTEEGRGQEGHFYRDVIGELKAINAKLENLDKPLSPGERDAPPPEVSSGLTRTRARYISSALRPAARPIVVSLFTFLLVATLATSVRQADERYGFVSPLLASLSAYTPEPLDATARAFYEATNMLGKNIIALFGGRDNEATKLLSNETTKQENSKPTPVVAGSPANSATSALEKEVAALRAQIAQIDTPAVTVTPMTDYTKIREAVDAILASYALGGITETEVNRRLGVLEGDLRLAMANITVNTTANDATYRAVALSNRIDNLGGITLNNTTVTGTFEGLTDVHIPNDITASNYLPLSGGTLSSVLIGTAGTFNTLTVSSITATSTDASSFMQASTTRLSVFDTLYIGGTATTSIVGDNATSTFASRVVITRTPSLAHTFSAWVVDDPDAAVLDAPFVINPASAAADTNLLGLAVGDSAKFLVDAEGDIFANSLTTEGSVNVGETTIASLTVENSTVLGDAVGDTVTVNGIFIANASSTFAAPLHLANNLSASSTLTLSGLGIFESGFISGASSTVSGPFHISDHLSASSTLTLSGLGIFESGFIAGASSTVSGPFHVTDNFSASSTLTLGGLGIFESGFIAGASSTVSGPFHVTDNIAGSSTLVIDQSAYLALTGGSVGIASSTPWGLLSVEIGTGDPGFVVSNNGSSSPAFVIGGVNQNGFVGIGTSSPMALFHIANDVEVDEDGNTIGNGEVDPAILLTGTTTSVLGGGEPYNWIFGVDISDEGKWKIASSTALGTDDRFVIDGAGNVGIGTAAPGNKLQVVGDKTDAYVTTTMPTSEIRITRDNSEGNNQVASISFHASGGSGNSLGSINLINPSTSSHASDLSFQLRQSGGGTVEIMRLLSTGDVGIGVTTPTEMLHISSSTPNPDEVSILIANTQAGTDDISSIYLGDSVSRGVAIKGRQDAATSGHSLSFWTNASAALPVERMTIDAGGNVGFGDLQTSGADDEACFDVGGLNSEELVRVEDDACGSSALRFKDDIRDLDYGLEEVLALRPVMFRWKKEYKPNFQLDRTGFIAEEMFDVVPEVVTYEGYDENGLPDGEIKGIDYEKLTSVLASAIQDIAHRISLVDAPTSTPSIYIASDGSVGIGSGFSSTTPPSHALEVAGDVAATGFVNLSTRDAKKDIVEVRLQPQTDLLKSDFNRSSWLEKIKNTRIYTYRYAGDETQEMRLGLIAEEAPPEVLSFDGKGVDIYKLASFTLAGVQELTARVESQDDRITKLEQAISNFKFQISNFQPNPDDQQDGGFSLPDSISQILDSMLDSMKDFGLTVVDGVAHFTKLVVDELFVTKLVVENLTAKTVTAQELCTEDICVNREQLRTLLEKAGVGNETTNQENNETIEEPSQPEPTEENTPPVTEEGAEDTASSTPPVAEEPVVEEPTESAEDAAATSTEPAVEEEGATTTEEGAEEAATTTDAL